MGLPLISTNNLFNTKEIKTNKSDDRNKNIHHLSLPKLTEEINQKLFSLGFCSPGDGKKKLQKSLAKTQQNYVRALHLGWRRLLLFSWANSYTKTTLQEAENVLQTKSQKNECDKGKTLTVCLHIWLALLFGSGRVLLCFNLMGASRACTQTKTALLVNTEE